ncbi:hypothetical protein EV188_107205 [Actinomycetospora succinea]|uniref:Uncharacterized protein n=1 Tax=Actinomycetospora succinea TaxID=663603 RepID=A0A4R6V8V6_9PSEU|nr:hypothetical protein [Actinomycetospora succinea]TDQ52828.1 hypothetical protein EV188_107205 [Actinomycetospora succinea]
MATSRLGRFFGRGRDQQADDTAPPAYTGVGAPRPYDPPPGAPGHGIGGYGASAPRPPVGVVTRAQYDEAVRKRREADQHVEWFERFDAKLSEQIHHATEEGRTDYVRELLSRQRAVRARLEEAEMRRNRLRDVEEQLGVATR